MRMSLWVVGALSVLFLVQAGHALSASPRLLVEGDALQPSTTLEIRFPTPMVESELLGVAVENSPLRIDPALPGAFTWLSRSSGVYVPSAPPALGTSYRIGLQPGLKDANGEIMNERFERKLSTPPFRMTVLQTGASKKKVIPPQPKVRMAFNLAVKEGAGFQFLGDGGEVVEAEVRYANKRDRFRIADEDGDWIARWQHTGETKMETDEEGDGSKGQDKSFTDRLIVTPVRTLSPGVEWRLEREPELESLDGSHQLAEGRKIPLGRVEPFVVESVTPSSFVNEGRSVSIGFSSRLAPDFDANSPSHFFRIEPAVADLVFEDNWRSIVVRGSFERGVEYSVVIDPSLLSSELLPISGELRRTFTFAPVKPRVYLPEFTGHQLSEGRRQFEVLSVNLKQLKVTALAVDPKSMAQAVAAFKNYDRPWKDIGDSGEPYQALPKGSIAGKVIFEKTYDLANRQIDVAQHTELDWSEILGAHSSGGILLTVEGVPLPDTGGTRPAAQAVMQLTDLGVLWKHASGGLRVEVFSMHGGEQMADVWVRLLDEKFAELATATTDAQGGATVAMGEKPAWLVVGKDADVLALPMGPSAGELPMAGFGLPIYYRGWTTEDTGQDQRCLLFTDRPLYRPGETVHVKGLLRRIGEDGLELATNETATLRLNLPKGKGQTTVEVTTDDHGAFDTSLELDGAVVGKHRLSISLSNSYHSTSFLVAEFQPNAFEVDVALPRRIEATTPVEAEVMAKYFFGAPISGAQMRWTLQSRPGAFTASGFENFSFGSAGDENRKTLTVRGEAPLDGKARIIPRLPDPEDKPQYGVLTVEVTDLNQQTVTARSEYTRDASDFYLGVTLGDRRVVGSGEELTVLGVALAPDGQPLKSPVEVEAELVCIEHQTVRVMGAGGAISFRSETTEKSEAQARGATLVPVKEDGKWHFDEGGTATFTPVRPGSYALRLKAADSKGRPVTAERMIHVSGEARMAWGYRHPSQVDLVADRSEYHVGDTARILVKTPVAGSALVSVERGDRILRQFRVELQGNAPVIEVPVLEGDGPNVYVSVMVIRGAADSTRKFKSPDYRYSVCGLKVANPRTNLDIQITPVGPVVEPGDEVSVEIAVTGSDGVPVANAGVTFFAVDDGILAMTGYERPDPQAVFGKLLPLNVRTGITLLDLFPEDPEDLEFGNKGYLIGGGGMEGPGAKLRTNFPGTAVWLPSLRTGADGRVTATFTAPDALTRYRLVAVVDAEADRFGSAESSVAIRKPLMLLSAIGQIAHVGDELVARAVLRNETGVDGVATVTLQLDGTARMVNAPASIEFPLKNGEARAVDIPVDFIETGEAHWQWSARMVGGDRVFDDAVAVSLRVGSPAPLLREIYLSELKKPVNDLLAGVNPQLLEGTGTVDVVLSNTRLASLRGAADDLLTYPYGCAEQLVSALIPWLTVTDLAPVLPEMAVTPEDRASTIRDGMAKILALKTDGGGLSYWPSGGEAQLFPSAWAAVALAHAEKQGLEVSTGWDELLNYLSGELRGLGDRRSVARLDDYALAVYALASAGLSEPAYHELLLGRKAELSHEGRALLALAMLVDGGKENGKEIRWLLNEGNRAPGGDTWFGSGSRSLAVRLFAWCRHDPKSREVATLTAELLAARHNGKWRTTQENAWALLALGDYFIRVEGKLRSVDATLVHAANKVPVNLTTEQLTATWQTEFGPQTPPGPLTVENRKRRNLFGETRFAVRPPVVDQPRQDRGYAVSRRYQKIGGDGELEDAVDLQVGDRVLVTLRVESARPGHFLAIDDPLPAILEAVNPDFQTQAVGGGERLERSWRADFCETRADRVVYFCDHLPAGAFTFRYLARVRSAGRVIAPATKAEEMYRPERFGLGATARLESKGADAR